MRDIAEIKKEITELSKSIDKETWCEIRTLLDEIFKTYAIKSKQLYIDRIKDDLMHYERQYKKRFPDVEIICTHVNMIIDGESEESQKYKLRKLFFGEKV